MPNFGPLADAYDALIDWPKRLANEEAFFRDIFARAAARRVLDAACGTGRHAERFHSWGLEVEAADISPAMLDRARLRVGARAGLTFTLRPFDEALPAGTLPFDVAVCLGNSLALAPDLATVGRALSTMVQAVRPGGIAVVQVLNLYALPEGAMVWQKSVLADLPVGRRLIVKGVRRAGDVGHVELLVLDPATGQRQSESPCFLGLTPERLSAVLPMGTVAQFFGSYRQDAYVPGKSPDVILVAQRAGVA